MVPTVPSLQKICDAFGISLSQLFAEEGEAVVLTEGQHEVLEKWNALSSEQKTALSGFLHTL